MFVVPFCLHRDYTRILNFCQANNDKKSKKCGSPYWNCPPNLLWNFFLPQGITTQPSFLAIIPYFRLFHYPSVSTQFISFSVILRSIWLHNLRSPFINFLCVTHSSILLVNPFLFSSNTVSVSCGIIMSALCVTMYTALFCCFALSAMNSIMCSKLLLSTELSKISS